MIPEPGLINSLDRVINDTQAPAQKFLQFDLSKEIAALLKVEDIAEVVQVPKNKLLPIPQMPKCVLGIYNWRGEMLWTIALNNFLLGLPLASQLDSSSASNMTVIVAVIDGQHLGLVVEQVNDIEWHETHLIQPPRAQLFPSQLLPFMQGYLSDSGTIILDPLAIARSPLIQPWNSQVNY